jgi:hypothetical protein
MILARGLWAPRGDASIVAHEVAGDALLFL